MCQVDDDGKTYLEYNNQNPSNQQTTTKMTASKSNAILL